MTQTNAVAVASEGKPDLLAFEVPFSAEEFAVVVAENFGNDLVPRFDRIKMPSGTTAAFTVPSDSDENGEVVRELYGVVLLHHKMRSYWKSKDSQNVAPDCASLDGKSGYGLVPALGDERPQDRDCATCPMSQWLDRDDGSRQAPLCKNQRRVYLLQHQEALPVQLTLPPTSLKPFDDFVNTLTRKGRGLGQVCVKIGLEQGKSESGQTFAKCRFTNYGEIEPAHVKAIRERASSLRGYMQKGQNPDAPEISEALVLRQALEAGEQPDEPQSTPDPDGGAPFPVADAQPARPAPQPVPNIIGKPRQAPPRPAAVAQPQYTTVPMPKPGEELPF